MLPFCVTGAAQQKFCWGNYVTYSQESVVIVGYKDPCYQGQQEDCPMELR